jgi:esterase/lipase superfamily enzyme
MGGKFETEDWLDGYHDEEVYFHSCLQWLPNVWEGPHLSAMKQVEMILAVGEHDFCRGSNEYLSKLLWGKDISNQLAVWNGGVHDWPVWREMISHYLPW